MEDTSNLIYKKGTNEFLFFIKEILFIPLNI